MKYLKDSMKWLYSKVTDFVLQETTEEDNYDFTSYINRSNDVNKIDTTSESPSAQEILNDLFNQGYYCRDEFLERKRKDELKNESKESSSHNFNTKVTKRKRKEELKNESKESSSHNFNTKVTKRKRKEEKIRKKVKIDIDDEYVCRILEFKEKYKKSQKKAFLEANIPYIKRKVEPLSKKKIEGSFVQKKIQKLRRLASIENRNLTNDEIAFVLENSSLLVYDSVSPTQALKIGKIVNYIKNYENKYKPSFTERYRIKIDEPLDRRGIFLDYYQEILEREKKEEQMEEENKKVIFRDQIQFFDELQENDRDSQFNIQLGTNQTDEEIYGIPTYKNTSITHNSINFLEKPSQPFSKYSFFPENISEEKSKIQTQNFTSTEPTEQYNDQTISKNIKEIQNFIKNEGQNEIPYYTKMRPDKSQELVESKNEIPYYTKMRPDKSQELVESENEIPYYTKMRPNELQEFRERENKIEKLKKEISPNLLKELDSIYELIDSPIFSYLPENIHYKDKDIMYYKDDVSYGILPYEYRHLQNLPPVILKKALDPNNTDPSIPFIHLGKVTAEEEEKYFSENNLKKIMKKEKEI
ncbi:hypothetical protein CWI37_1324p0010 [Hamiltosporidium tvaerminnensis]|uniref:Uncharacterized protein n=2 Tax=Hamiltosporidium tvaerminnensis TaxID=1176355 RepID=A0A4V2JUC3_9MICR|nr:hypothetical protein CWI37_1324p0010 [Hamiltosporidium tvaerminnensis]